MLKSRASLVPRVPVRCIVNRNAQEKKSKAPGAKSAPGALGMAAI